MDAVSQARQALQRDPKKAAVLTVLVLVLTFLVMRGLRAAGGPPGASASASALQAGWTVEAGGAVQAPTLGKLSALVARWHQQPVPAAGRDLFAMPALIAVPSAGNAEADGESARAAAPDHSLEAGRFWRQIDAQMRSRDERNRHREATVASVLRGAGKLAITSIVHGPDCRAIVGGELVRPGEAVETADGMRFTVFAIEQWRVLVEHGGMRVALPVGAAEPYLLDE